MARPQIYIDLANSNPMLKTCTSINGFSSLHENLNRLSSNLRLLYAGSYCITFSEDFNRKIVLLLGVDLVPIKSIKNVTTFTADITTETCRQVITPV